MDHHHGILGRIPVSQAGTPAHLDKGCETGEHHIDLRLVQSPDIQQRIHTLIRCPDLHPGLFFIPEAFQLMVNRVHGSRIPIFLSHPDAVLPSALTEQKDQPDLFPRRQSQTLMKGTAMISPQLTAPGKASLLHSQRICLRPVGSDEAVPQTVISVRIKIRSEKLISEFLIEQIMFDDPLLIGGSCSVQAHLIVLVVHLDVMEGKLQIRKNTDFPLSAVLIPDRHIPDLHRILHGHRHLLGCGDSPVSAFVDRVGHAMPAAVFCLIQRLSYRLPGNAPVISILIVPQIHIMSRPVHGNGVPPEARDPVILRGLIKDIPSGSVVQNSAHIPDPQIVGPGNRQIHPVDHIFFVFIVKMPVPHKYLLYDRVIRIRSL